MTLLTVPAVAGHHHGAVVHWSRWRSLIILIMATALTSACADLVTENIQPLLDQPSVSQVRSHHRTATRYLGRFSFFDSWSKCSHSHLILQYFIGVTVLAMVPEIPEIVNGIQFALQNNISLRWIVHYSSSEKKSLFFLINSCLSLQPGGWNLYCCSSLHASDPNPGLVQCILCKTPSP